MLEQEADNSYSIGSLLRGARQEQNLTLEEAAKQTRIPIDYIRAFEDDDHWRHADIAYTRLYLKAYAEFLGYNATTLLSLYKKERSQKVGDNLRDTANRAPTRELPAWAMMVAPRMIQGAFVVLFILATATYFGYEFKRMIAPPTISLYTPHDGLVTSDRSIEVTGHAEKEVGIRINGKSISPDGKGNFTDTVELREGVNIITVKSSKQHSKDMTYTRRVIVMPEDRPAAMR